MHITSRASALCALLASTIAAQAPIGPRNGFVERPMWEDGSSPWGFVGFAIGLGTDDLFVARRNEVSQITPQGGAVPIHSLPNTHAVGLLTATPGRLALLFTDFDSNVLFRFDLVTNATTSQPVPANSFDIAIAPTGETLVNANPRFPAPNAATGIWLVDPNRGTQHRELIRLSGPSGPLAFDRSGNLWVGLIPQIVPPAPGTVQLLRFDRNVVQATLNGGPSISAAQASFSLSGLDGAYDLAFDPRDRAYITDVNNAAIVRTIPGGTALDATTWSDGVDSPLNLQFVDIGAGTFDAFGLNDGGALYIGAVEYGRRSAVHIIDPARPVLASSVGNTIAPGPFTIDATGMPGNTQSWLCLSIAAGPEQVIIDFGGRPLWFALDITRRMVCATTTTDVTGAFQLPFNHFLGSATVHIQAVALDATSPEQALVSSNPLTVQLIP